MTRRPPMALAVIALLVFAATPAIARTALSSANARGAVVVVAQDVGSITPAARRCLARAFAMEPKLAAATERAGDMDSLSASKQAVVMTIVARCAPDAVAEELAAEFGTEPGDPEVLPAERDCLAKSLGGFDRDVLTQAIVNGGVTGLDDHGLEVFTRFIMTCMPTAMGRVVIDHAPSEIDIEPDATDAEARCVGEAMLPGLGVAGFVAAVRGVAPTPTMGVALLKTMGACIPRLMVEMLAASATTAGTPASTAHCIAERIVGDAALLESVLTASATGGAAPPGLREAAAPCL